MSSDSEPPRPKISIRHPWFATISRVDREFVGLSVAAIVYLGGGALDWCVTHRYLPRISLMLAGAAIALAVGVLVFRILTDIQERYQAMLDRLSSIVELNHHIRNALQVIAYHNVRDRSQETISQVNVEILRIETALREISVALGSHEAISSARRVTPERKKR